MTGQNPQDPTDDNRQQRQAQVIMPDVIEETPLLNVTDTKGYQRSGMGMIAIGLALVVLIVLNLVFHGRIFIVMPFIAAYLIIHGAVRVMAPTKDDI